MKRNAAKGYEKTNPIQTQLPKGVKLMQSVYLQRIMKRNAAKGYEKTKPKQTQLPKGVKLMQSVYLQRIMKKIAAKGYEKTNPNKANFLKAQMTTSRRCFKHTLIAPALVGNTFCCQKNHAFSYRT